MIAMKHVSKSFDGGHTYAVQDLSLDIDEGRTVVLLGESGCGKTTTLKMINRLVPSSGGDIYVDERNIADQPTLELRRSIGYVFQGIGLFPHMTVRQNVTVVPRLIGWDRSKRDKRADELLEMIGLPPGEYADRRPSQLSGGQQQRVGLARALAADPKYLLMDEPFGALDAVTRDQLQEELIKLRKELNKTIIFVTHDLFEAIRLGDRIAVMNNGAIEQVGKKDELMNNPASKYVEQLFSHAEKQAALLEGGES